MHATKIEHLRKFEEIKQSAIDIKLEKTEEFLTNLYAKASFEIISDYPTINSINFELEKGDRCFKYSAGKILPIGPPVKYQSKSYGFQEPFSLKSGHIILKAFKGAASITLNLGKGFSSNGELWELESENFKKKTIHRAILPLPQFSKKPMDFIDCLPFKTGSSLRATGYLMLEIDNNKIGLFDYKLNETDSLIIDCYNKIEQKKFENIISSILFCFALISGCLIRNEIILVQYSNFDLNEITGFQFRRIEESTNGMPAIDPELLRRVDKSKSINPYIPSILFENMVNKCLSDLRLLRSIRIITESFRYPLEIKASTYSVALETLKNIIIEENAETINPFRSKKVASKTIKELKSIVNKVNKNDFNNKQSVLNKVEQLNQVGNRDSFLLAFKILEIELNDDDIRCIDVRNDFLHGRIPFENEIGIEDYQLQHIVYKLHLLVTSLIMKFCGYSGFMLNNIKLIDLIHFKKNIKETLFRKI